MASGGSAKCSTFSWKSRHWHFGHRAFGRRHTKLPPAAHRSVQEDMAAALAVESNGSTSNCRGCGMAALLTEESVIARCAYGSYLVWQQCAKHSCRHCNDAVLVIGSKSLYFYHVCTHAHHHSTALNTMGVSGIPRAKCTQKTAHQPDIVTFYSKVCALLEYELSIATWCCFV